MFFNRINDIIWGPWMLSFILGTGMFLLYKLKFYPLKNIGYAFRLFFKSFDNSSRSTLEPVMTSLAAMMGTGNILGVSTALLLGGPGALLWMNIAAFIGMTIAYAENMLSIKYQKKDPSGNYYGGPMYVMIQSKMPMKHILAVLFSIFTIGASVGMGNLIQSNCAATELKEVYGFPTLATGFIFGLLALAIFLSKTTSIGKVCTYLVPLMSLIYGASLIIIIIINRNDLISVIDLIFKSAFYPKSIIGGVGGSLTTTFFPAMRWGMARGIFSNETGMGSSAIALASSKSDDYVQQGYLSMINVFFDTMLMCTLTGLAILSTGLLNINSKVYTGTQLIHKVFTTNFGFYGGFIITVCIVLFAFATIIGWAFYGKMALKFLVKDNSKILNLYPILYSFMIVVGAVCSVGQIWNLSDICNGLMIVPNLICLLFLNKEIVIDTLNHEKKKSLKTRGTSKYRARRFLK